VAILDTCSFVWLGSEPARLSARARQVLAGDRDRHFVSAISAFEIAMKYYQGKLRLSHPPSEWLRRALAASGVQEIPLDSEIAVRSCELPPLHRDPSDRIIIATAQLHRLDILTPDTLIARYPDVKVLW
jgi:PIN domain nuclease of toxin-antitoxin system